MLNACPGTAFSNTMNTCKRGNNGKTLAPDLSGVMRLHQRTLVLTKGSESLSRGLTERGIDNAFSLKRLASRRLTEPMHFLIKSFVHRPTAMASSREIISMPLAACIDIRFIKQ